MRRRARKLLAARAGPWMSDPKLRLTTARFSHHARPIRSLAMLDLALPVLLGLGARLRGILLPAPSEPGETRDAHGGPDQDPSATDEADRHPDGRPHAEGLGDPDEPELPGAHLPRDEEEH